MSTVLFTLAVPRPNGTLMLIVYVTNCPSFATGSIFSCCPSPWRYPNHCCSCPQLSFVLLSIPLANGAFVFVLHVPNCPSPLPVPPPSISSSLPPWYPNVRSSSSTLPFVIYYCPFRNPAKPESLLSLTSQLSTLAIRPQPLLRPPPDPPPLLSVPPSVSTAPPSSLLLH